MPSPFPGMDPYLESPDGFPNLHGDLITHMKGALQRSLPLPYYAQSNYRFWLERSERHTDPDVEVVRAAEKPRRRSRGGAAVTKLQMWGPLVITVETVEDGPGVTASRGTLTRGKQGTFPAPCPRRAPQ